VTYASLRRREVTAMAFDDLAAKTTASSNLEHFLVDPWRPHGEGRRPSDGAVRRRGLLCVGLSWAA